MKAKVLKGINALLAFVMGLLGFNSCVIQCEYGVPNATYEVSGSVTDTNNKPIENIRIIVKGLECIGFEKMDTIIELGHEFRPAMYTKEDGGYDFGEGMGFPSPTITIVAEDTAGIYAPDSALIEVKYDRSGVSKGDHWNEGKATIVQDFKLKKKP